LAWLGFVGQKLRLKVASRRDPRGLTIISQRITGVTASRQCAALNGRDIVADLRGRFVEPALAVPDGVEKEALAAASRAVAGPLRLFLRGMFCVAWLRTCLPTSTFALSSTAGL
jgi:hypothetical protein